MATPKADPTIEEFDGPPQVATPVERSWIVRAANFVVRLTRADQGANLERTNNPDEYFVLSIGCDIRVVAGDEVSEVPADTLVIVPPGPSTITTAGPGVVISIFSSFAEDLLTLASNAAEYDNAARAAPIVSWPPPVGGYRLRTYPLEMFSRPDTLMRLFRTRNLMVNVFRPREAPRDVSQLSPHSHADFEQGTLCLQGDWIHYLRRPWTRNLTEWRPDLAAQVGSPSLTVIPAGTIHTSRNLSEGPCRLVDVFAGPRADFSRRPGLVCNAAEYPLPPEVAALPPLETAD